MQASRQGIEWLGNDNMKEYSISVPRGCVVDHFVLHSNQCAYSIFYHVETSVTKATNSKRQKITVDVSRGATTWRKCDQNGNTLFERSIVGLVARASHVGDILWICTDGGIQAWNIRFGTLLHSSIEVASDVFFKIERDGFLEYQLASVDNLTVTSTFSALPVSSATTLLGSLGRLAKNSQTSPGSLERGVMRRLSEEVRKDLEIISSPDGVVSRVSVPVDSSTVSFVKIYAILSFLCACRLF